MYTTFGDSDSECGSSGPKFGAKLAPSKSHGSHEVGRGVIGLTEGEVSPLGTVLFSNEGVGDLVGELTETCVFSPSCSPETTLGGTSMDSATPGAGGAP